MKRDISASLRMSVGIWSIVRNILSLLLAMSLTLYLIMEWIRFFNLSMMCLCFWIELDLILWNEMSKIPTWILSGINCCNSASLSIWLLICAFICCKSYISTTSTSFSFLSDSSRLLLISRSWTKAAYYDINHSSGSNLISFCIFLNIFK